MREYNAGFNGASVEDIACGISDLNRSASARQRGSKQANSYNRLRSGSGRRGGGCRRQSYAPSLAIRPDNGRSWNLRELDYRLISSRV